MIDSPICCRPFLPESRQLYGDSALSSFAEIVIVLAGKSYNVNRGASVTLAFIAGPRSLYLIRV